MNLGRRVVYIAWRRKAEAWPKELGSVYVPSDASEEATKAAIRSMQAKCLEDAGSGVVSASIVATNNKAETAIK